jgi:glycosyltransferase involved in cell wall biosynthesis
MKCAFILYANQLGGHELMSSSLANRFIEAGHDVTLYLPVELKNKQRLIDDISNIKIKTYYSVLHPENKISIKSFFISSLKRFKLCRSLKSNYDLVVNCQGSFEQNWILSFFCRLLAIKIASYVPYTSFPSERKVKFSLIRDYFYHVLAKLPLRYIVIHDFYKKHLEEKFNIKNDYILIVNNEVNVKCDTNKVEANNLAKPFVFMLPGRIYFAQKGQDILINAIKKIFDRQLNLKFLFVGDGPDISKLEESISSNSLSKICSIQPWQDDVNKLYRSCDCVLLPSRYEGVSLVMLEAIFLKKPLLASDLDVNRSFIKEGFLFENGNSIDLAQKLLQMYNLHVTGCWDSKDNYNDLSQYEDSNIVKSINNWLLVSL